MKNVSVLIDEENDNIHTNFNENEITENDIVLAILHLSFMLDAKGIDLIDVFNGIIECVDESRQKVYNKFMN